MIDPNISQTDWPELRAKVLQRWTRLGEEDLAYIQGNAELAAVRIRERYDIPQEEAARQWAEFRRQCPPGEDCKDDRAAEG